MNNQDLQKAAKKALDSFVKHQEEINLSHQRFYDECLGCGVLVIQEGQTFYHKTSRIPCVLLENAESLDKGGKFFEVEMPYGREYAYYYKI